MTTRTGLDLDNDLDIDLDLECKDCFMYTQNLTVKVTSGVKMKKLIDDYVRFHLRKILKSYREDLRCDKVCLSRY